MPKKVVKRKPKKVTKRKPKRRRRFGASLVTARDDNRYVSIFKRRVNNLAQEGGKKEKLFDYFRSIFKIGAGDGLAKKFSKDPFVPQDGDSETPFRIWKAKTRDGKPAPRITFDVSIAGDNIREYPKQMEEFLVGYTKITVLTFLICIKLLSRDPSDFKSSSKWLKGEKGGKNFQATSAEISMMKYLSDSAHFDNLAEGTVEAVQTAVGNIPVDVLKVWRRNTFYNVKRKKITNNISYPKNKTSNTSLITKSVTADLPYSCSVNVTGGVDTDMTINFRDYAMGVIRDGSLNALQINGKLAPALSLSGFKTGMLDYYEIMGDELRGTKSTSTKANIFNTLMFTIGITQGRNGDIDVKAFFAEDDDNNNNNNNTNNAPVSSLEDWFGVSTKPPPENDDNDNRKPSANDDDVYDSDDALDDDNSDDALDDDNSDDALDDDNRKPSVNDGVDDIIQRLSDLNTQQNPYADNPPPVPPRKKKPEEEKFVGNPFNNPRWFFGKRSTKIKRKVSKKKKGPSSALKKLCKRLKVKLTTKRAGKRVYKSVKVLKAQCRKAAKKSSFGKPKKKKVSKKKKGPSSALKKLCKRLKVKLTTKRAGKRVYKSEKVLKGQCRKASKAKLKKRRKSKFGG